MKKKNNRNRSNRIPNRQGILIRLEIKKWSIGHRWSVICTTSRRPDPRSLRTKSNKQKAIDWANDWATQREYDFPRDTVEIVVREEVVYDVLTR